MRSLVIFFILFIFFGSVFSNEVDVRNSWKKDIIYFIVTDRFFNGNFKNDINVNKKNIRAYHGGDIEGIIKKLDYLKELGITAIWFSPVMDNRDSLFFGGAGYHGYWIKDFYKVDEHFGNMKILQRFCNECRKRNIKIILDIVVNHTDWNAGFKEKGYCHNLGNIKNWDDPNELEKGDIYGMPDLDQDKPEVYDFLLNMTKFWINKTNCDGIRFDAVKHVGHKFWKKYLKDLKNYLKNKKPNFLFLGEVLHGDPYYVLNYLKDGFNCVFDFPMYYHFDSVFGKSKGVFPMVEEMKKDRLYRNPELMSPFLDNHDVKRFMSRCKDNNLKRMKLALTALLTYRGIPTIYYGSEVPFLGENEDQSRKDMIFNKNKLKLFNYIKQLIKIRKNNESLYDTGYKKVLFTSNDVLAYTRISKSHETVLVFNLSNKHKKIFIPLSIESKIPKNGKIKDILNNNNFQIFKGKIYVKLSPLSAAIIPYKCKKDSHLNDIKKNFIRPDYPAIIKKIKVTFSVKVKCNKNENIYIIGSNKIIGNWNKDKAVKLVKNKDNYIISLDIPTNTDIEYKFIIKGKSSVIWENGNNRKIKLTNNDKPIIIKANFRK